jgi:hypothetical protein
MPVMARFSQALRRRQISSVADIRIVSDILQRYSKLGAAISVWHARNMQVRDFENGDNFVLIGSARSNPWASLFDRLLTFHLQSQFGSSCFEKAHARANEQRLYCRGKVCSQLSRSTHSLAGSPCPPGF